MKKLLMTFVAVGLAGCGQPDRFDGRSGSVSRAAPMASGPISNACIASDRKSRSRALCGCIQAAADQTLNPSDQRRAAAFYRDPHKAQEIRQSDRSRDESFWKAYRAYGERAERLCR
ncbi:hypothetical protein FIU86_14490 [Roseovarius sp. THAF9]|uniref:hypothetical protein n=1 Tax=Roseovarius sp. THAF9 TaxID=2587847 RepID=UPI0012AA21D5|nr:hypothetical protein [Roseovarius sp. THAF9]QFT94055.1 hypothetical protein FIU86_14490 [Roseovarius sp. THAF9]